MLEGGGNNQDEGFEGEDPEQQEVEDGEEERLLNNDLDDEEENAEGGVEEADEGQGNLNLTENGEGTIIFNYYIISSFYSVRAFIYLAMSYY